MGQRNRSYIEAKQRSHYEIVAIQYNIKCSKVIDDKDSNRLQLPSIATSSLGLSSTTEGEARGLLLPASVLRGDTMDVRHEHRFINPSLSRRSK